MPHNLLQDLIPFFSKILHFSGTLTIPIPVPIQCTVILILVSQRADDDVIRLFGTARMKQELAEEQLRQRGKAPTKLELLVVLYVFGFMWEEVQEIFTVGMKSYLRNMWNVIDFLRNSLYVSVMCLRFFAYVQQTSEISRDAKMAYVPRELWHDYDPQLIAEGLFAAANVFSALKLVHMFSINPHLGPLQISLGRMVIDIVKFFFIYSLVLFAFACGLNQLLWYFADLEKSKCYSLPDGEADWAGHSDSCMKWRRFGNLFESSQSLFWASFGMVGLEDFELTGIKSYTRFWGLLMFGSYSVINVIVLLNLLIAMMSNSYAMIDEQSDTEWKFARTKLWMSYFEDSATLPPPFNIIPSVKWLIRVFRKSSKEIDRKRSKKRQQKDKDNAYDNIMRSLVWRYVAAQHRKFEVNPVTEDDINEVKSEISTMRYEMLDIFENSGFDCSSASKREKPCRAKRNKVWERRLMKGFQVAPVNVVHAEDADYNVNGDADINEIKIEKEPSKPEFETPLERFRRVAHTVVAQSATHKWTVVLRGVTKNSQIGRCNNNKDAEDLKHLGKAIEEAKRLILLSPQKTCHGRESPIPIEFEDEKTSTLLELLNKISEEIDEHYDTPYKPATQMKNKQLLRAYTQQPHEVKPIITQHGYLSPANNSKYDAPMRSRTAPDIQINKTSNKNNNNNSDKTQTKSNELTLSAAKLANQLKSTQQNSKPPTTTTAAVPGKAINTSLKKAAPAAPTHGNNSNNHTHSHTPFSVEFGLAGRRPAYPPAYTTNNIDIDVVDLDDNEMQDFASADNFSDVSSIVNMSPTHERSKEGKLSKSYSVEKEQKSKSSTSTKPKVTDERQQEGGKAAHRPAPNPPSYGGEERGKRWL